MLKCAQRTAGGKGNEGLFIERGPRIVAAGLATAQAKEKVEETFKKYSLQDEVDALIRDAIIPTTKKHVVSKPTKHSDKRNAGIFTDVRSLINPPELTKFEALAEDLKNTIYTSYWNKPLGSVSDQVPLLPKGLNVITETMGTKPVFTETLYDVVLPKYPIKADETQSNRVGYQINRKYCTPAYDPNQIFGVKCNYDNRGTFAKQCMSDDRVKLGLSHARVSARKANFMFHNNTQLGLTNPPNNNTSCIPKDLASGVSKPPDNLPECLTICEFESGKPFFLRCLGHLNNLRKCLSKRFESVFFHKFYLHLKFLDKTKSGWLPKEVVYYSCKTRFVRIYPSLIEPLLETWNAFNGTEIEYKIFLQVINYREPLPTLPKIKDIPDECIQYSTTYGDMVKHYQKVDKSYRAGVPSGRYFDKDYPVIPHHCCKADMVNLPEESDAKSCLYPSTLTRFGVSHRDMYAKRSPEEVRRVFESIGEPISSENFNIIWDMAKKRHSQGWVSYATFREALDKHHI